MDFISGLKTELPAGLYTHLSHYRHDVFIDILGWNLNTPDGIEQDQFDREDTMYIIAKSNNGNINGCARLLPTTQPYLLQEVFPQLLNGAAPPESPDIWELSRFTAMDVSKSMAGKAGHLSSPIAVKLLESVIDMAAIFGVKKLITVSPVGVERLMRHAGFNVHRAGPPMVVDGYPLFACWIDVDRSRKKSLTDCSLI